jgi:LysM repeat protein
LGLWLRAGHLLPGTYVAGTAIGGRSLRSAETALAEAWSGHPITLVAGEDRWTATASELGLVLDAPATVRAAWDAGRSPGAWWSTLVRRRPLEVAPAWLLDAAAASRFLTELAPRVEVAARSAGLAVENGQLTTTPAVDGRQLDAAATLVALQAGAADMVASGRLELVTHPVAATLRDIGPARAAAEALLARSLPVRAWDAVRDERFAWDLPPAEWGPWLRLAGLGDDGTRPEWAVDGSAVAGWAERGAAAELGADRYLEAAPLVEAVTAALNGQPGERLLTVRHRPGTHVVASGDTIASIGAQHGLPYPWIQQANPGVGDDLRVGQTLALPSPDEMLPLAPVPGKRIVVSLADQQVQAFENGALKWEWPVSTGIDSSPTSPGVFQVQSHEESAYASNWDLNMPKFIGIYRPIPTSPFMNGFHGFPTRGRTGNQILWTNNLGHPVTFGCILLGTEASNALYDWAEAGTVVEVKP